MADSADGNSTVSPVEEAAPRVLRQSRVKRVGVATWGVLRAAFDAWLEDRAPTMGAAIAFYTTFSLAPILLLVIVIAGLVFGEEAAQGALFQDLRGILGNDGALALEAMIKHAYMAQSGPIATILGVAALLVTSTGVLTELQAALNIIWKVTARPGLGIWHFFRRRLLCFAIILVGGALLTAALAAGAALHAVSLYLYHVHLGARGLIAWLNLGIPLVMSILLFAMIFKILPDADIRWRDVWLGATITAVLFSIGKHLIALYIGSKSITSLYGAAGALAIIMIWVYYSTQILLFGAEVAKAYADRRKEHEASAR